MSRVLGVVIMCNEADRYLEAMLNAMHELVDGLVAYDDRSTDDSVLVAQKAGALVAVRPEGQPSFLEDDSSLREQAWRAMEDLLTPDRGDWILCLDTDEFLVDQRSSDPRAALQRTIEQAEDESCPTIELPVLEVFGATTDGVPLVRIDGEWGRIRAASIAQWRPGLTFAGGHRAWRRLPTAGGPMLRAGEPSLLHLGYLRKDERAGKQRRYQERGGHGSAHVRSITATPTLTAWKGNLPSPITATLKEEAQ